MTGTSVLLSLALLAMTLTDHRVWTSPSPRSLEFDTVKLTASNSLIEDVEVYGRVYSTSESIIPSRCCLYFKRNYDTCEELSALDYECTCTVVYQKPLCDNIVSFTPAVQMYNGSAVVFTVQDLDKAIRDITKLDRQEPHRTIPIIVLVPSAQSNEFYAQLGMESSVMVRIEVITTPDNPTDNGINNTRSATTFYFVVFAFTILLLLSLTWFVFNYLKRCHHMYTVKRQRVSNLYEC